MMRNIRQKLRAWLRKARKRLPNDALPPSAKPEISVSKTGFPSLKCEPAMEQVRSVVGPSVHRTEGLLSDDHTQQMQKPTPCFFPERVVDESPEGSDSVSSASRKASRFFSQCTDPQSCSRCSRLAIPYDSVLGKGTYGTVYINADSRNGRVVARKVADLKWVPIPAVIAPELRALAILRRHPHPNTLQQPKDELTVWIEGNDLNIITHYYPSSVSDHVGRDRSQFHHQGWSWSRDIVNGLLHLHSLGIIHRDISPGNILLNHHGSCVIADFGSCETLNPSFLQTVAVPGTVFGTAGFIAPELLCPHQDGLLHFDERVDFWSLGILLYELLVGWTSTLPVDFFRQRDSISTPLSKMGLSEETMLHNLMASSRSESMRNLIMKLRREDPTERLHGRSVLEFIDRGSGVV